MSGKNPDQRGRSNAPKAPVVTGVTTRSRSRGSTRPSPYPLHPPGTSSPGAPSGSAFQPRNPTATMHPRGAPSGPAIGPGRLQRTQAQREPLLQPQATSLPTRGAPCGLGTQGPRGPPSGPGIRPTRPQATPVPRGAPSGGVKRAQPRGCGSPAKRGPASPPPLPSRGTTPSPTYAGGLPLTPSKSITQGVARCSLEDMPPRGGVSQGPSTHSGRLQTPSAGATRGTIAPFIGQLGTPSRGVIQKR